MNRVTRDQLVTSFDANNQPAIRVQQGETFVMETNDRFATYEGPNSAPEAMEILKTMAGPVYIEGTRPGDTIKVEVLDVSLPLDYGWIGATPGRGPLGDKIPEFRKTKVAITDKGVLFGDNIKLPLRTMIGRIGVAPKDGPRGSNERGEFGGSMGNCQITKGATVYLPVAVPGAGLGLGDVHGAMGDGEITFIGLEIQAVVTIRVELHKGAGIQRPLIATADHWVTTGDGESLAAVVYGVAHPMGGADAYRRDGAGGCPRREASRCRAVHT